MSNWKTERQFFEYNLDQIKTRKSNLWLLLCRTMTLILVATKPQMGQVYVLGDADVIFSCLICKSMWYGADGCGKIFTWWSDPPSLNLGWTIGLAGVDGFSLSFFFFPPGVAAFLAGLGPTQKTFLLQQISYGYNASFNATRINVHLWD